jgi:hypothetical protein
MLKHTVNKVFYLIVLAGLIKIKIDSYVGACNKSTVLVIHPPQTVKPPIW